MQIWTRSRKYAALWVSVLSALTATAACSSSKVEGSSHRSAQTQSVRGMLGLVPNDASVTKYPVTVNLYPAGAKAAGQPVPAVKADQSTVAHFYSSLYTQGGMPGSDLTRQLAMYAPDPTKQVGLDAHDVGADISAGTPPDTYLAARGRFDRAAVDRAAHADKTWNAKLRTPSYDKTTVYSWLADNMIDMGHVRTGMFTDLGGSRRLALPNDTSLVYGRNDATVHGELDAVTENDRSLAGNSDFTAAADVLDAKHAYSAILTAAPPSVEDVAHPARSGAVPNPRLLGQLKAEALAPYRLAGVGITGVRQQPTVVIVLVNADAAGARTNVARLRAMIQHGTSARDQQSWSQLLAIQDVRASGRMTVATVTEKASPNLWSQLFQTDDTLLMHE